LVEITAALATGLAEVACTRLRALCFKGKWLKIGADG
jgi:hypothetical protein